MTTFIDWIVNNKTWLFSGAGLVALSALVAIYRNFRTNKSAAFHKQNTQTNQAISAEYAYQAGRDINISTRGNSPPKPAMVKLVSVDIIQGNETILSFRSQWNPESLSVDKNLDAYGIGKSQFARMKKKWKGLEKFERGFFPIVDIKLRNDGDSPAFLAYLDLEITLLEAKLDEIMYRAFPVNWEYTLLLDPHKINDFQSIPISQEVPQRGLDRFIVVVGHDMQYGEFVYADYRIHFSIRYNETETVDLGSHTIRVHAPVRFEKALHVKPRRIGFETTNK